MTPEKSSPQPAPVNDGGPAFPLVAEGHEHVLSVGLSLRDYFAARAGETDIAVQAEIIRAQLLAAGKLGILPDDYRVIARYMHADAMLKARRGAA